MNRKEFLLDAHSHTLVSGHAYNTIREMVMAAKEAGLKLLCITEHTMRMPGATHGIYFTNLKILPREIFGVEVYFGAENNIIDYKGTVDFEVDMEPEFFRDMDINIASLHMPCYTPGTVEENTSAILGAIKNPYIDIIGHPDDERMPLDYEKVVKAAKKYNKLLEVNNHSLDPVSRRYSGARKNYLEMLELCKKEKVEVVVNTDSHSEFLVGNFENALKILDEADFPDELIVNNNIERFKSHINRFRNQERKI